MAYRSKTDMLAIGSVSIELIRSSARGQIFKGRLTTVCIVTTSRISSAEGSKRIKPFRESTTDINDLGTDLSTIAGY